MRPGAALLALAGPWDAAADDIDKHLVAHPLNAKHDTALADERLSNRPVLHAVASALLSGEMQDGLAPHCDGRVNLTERERGR